MAFSSKSNTFTQNRSISFPCRSHPTTLRIQNELAKLKTWEDDEEASSSTSITKRICNGLSGLEELYRCVDDLYNLPLTKQALNEKWAHDELLDGSVLLLDICGVVRDYMSQIKENVNDIQSALRRRKRDSSSVESSIAKYTCLRKKMKKDSRKLIATMKKMDSKIDEGSPVLHISVIRVLKEVNGVSIAIFQSLLMLFSVSVSKSKTSKWSMVSKLLHKGAVGCEGQQDNINAFEKVDAALGSISKHGSSEGDRLQMAQNSLKALEDTTKMIENHLECMFRRLLRARVSLLNIASH